MPGIIKVHGVSLTGKWRQRHADVGGWELRGLGVLAVIAEAASVITSTQSRSGPRGGRLVPLKAMCKAAEEPMTSCPSLPLPGTSLLPVILTSILEGTTKQSFSWKSLPYRNSVGECSQRWGELYTWLAIDRAHGN